MTDGVEPQYWALLSCFLWRLEGNVVLRLISSYNGPSGSPLKVLLDFYWLRLPAIRQASLPELAFLVLTGAFMAMH